MFLPISGASPRIDLLGLRMNWHWVSGGRHWSSSSTPWRSVGLVRSLPVPPPRPAALLPPSRMWLILMLKGNSWPEWEEKSRFRHLQDRRIWGESPVKTRRRGGNLTEIRGEFVFGSDESWGGTFGGDFKTQPFRVGRFDHGTKKITVRQFNWNALVTKD